MSTGASSPPPPRQRRRPGARTRARLLEPTVIRALSSLEAEAASDHPDLPESARSVVGRNRLLELLAQVPDLDPQELRFLAFYADPANTGKSLGRLVSDFGLLPAHFVKLLARAEGARALMQALRIAAEHTPEVVRGAMTAAKVEVSSCPLCRGGGADPSSTPENYVPCGSCSGSGQVRSLPDVARVKLALEVGGVVKSPGGMTLNVSAQASAAAQAQSATVSGDVFDRFRSASQRIMRGVLRPRGQRELSELPEAREPITVEAVFAGGAEEDENVRDMPVAVAAPAEEPRVPPNQSGLGPPPGRRPEPRS